MVLYPSVCKGDHLGDDLTPWPLLAVPPPHPHTAALLWAPLQAIGAASATGPPASTTTIGGLLLLPPRAGPSPLADLALHLLLLLVYCPDDPPASHNPFRR